MARGRSLEVRLVGNDRDLRQKLARSGRDVAVFEGKVKRHTAAVGSHFRSFAKIGAGAAGLGIGAIIKAGVDYEKQMARVRAVTGSTGKQFNGLNKLAKKLGAETKFSASDAAAGMYELAAAGFKVGEITKSLPGVLSLAAAGNISVADAAEISGNALRGFHLRASAAGHVADVLAQAVNSSSVEMSDLRDSLKYVGPIARLTGQSFEDMTAAIDLMGNAGIKGEQAGTSLRGGLVRLVRPTKMAQKGLEAMHLSVQDLQGPHGLKPLPQLIGLFEKHTQGMSKASRSAALAQVFGTEALTGWAALVDQGSKKISENSKALQNSQGVAKHTATIMNSTVAGAWENFRGSVETAGISLFEHFQKPLRKVLLEGAHLVNTAGKSIQGFFDDVFGSKKFKAGDIGGALSDALNQHHVGEKVAKALGKVLGFAATKVAPQVAKLFIGAFMHAGVWGQLLTVGFLAKKMGAFGAAGGMAADAFSSRFRRGAGGRAAESTGQGVAAGLAQGVVGGTASRGGFIRRGIGRVLGRLGSAGRSAGSAIANTLAANVLGGVGLRRGGIRAGLGRVFRRVGGSVGSSTGVAIARDIAGTVGGGVARRAGGIRGGLGRVFRRIGGAVGSSTAGTLAGNLATSVVGGTSRRSGKMRSGLGRIFRRLGSAMGISAAERGAAAIAGEGAATGIIGRIGGGRRWNRLKNSMKGLGSSLGSSMSAGIIAGITIFGPDIAREVKQAFTGKGPGPKRGSIPGDVVHFLTGIPNSLSKTITGKHTGGAEGGIVTPTGIVRGFAAGGVAGLDPRDTVPAMLRPGEGVLTPEAVRTLGGPATVTVLNSAATNKAAKPSKRAAPLNLAAPMDDERKDLDKVLLKVTKSLKTIPDAGKKQSQLTAKNVSDHLVRGGKGWVKAVGKAGSGIVDRFSDMRVGGGREARKLRVGVGSHFDVMRKVSTGHARGMASSVVSSASGMRKHTGDQAHGLRVGVGNHFEGLRKNVRVKMRAVADHTQNGIQAARKYAAVGAKGVRNTVASSYSSMDNAVFRGIGYVSSATSSALKGLGGKGLSFGVSRPRKLAVGGMISGAGRQDTEMVMAAPGEAILNRHQQPIVESALASTYGMSLDDVFQRIRTPHYMAKGGKVRKYARGGLHPGIARAVSSVLHHFPGLSVTSTTGGGHAAGSYHYKGEAADISGSSGLMFQAANWIKQVMGRNLTEGIHNPNLSIKFGKRVPPSFWGGATWAGHANHIHLAVAGMLGALGGLGGGGTAPQLKAPRVSGRGPLQRIAQAALRKVTGAANNKLSQSSDLLGFSGGGSDTQNMALGRKMMLAAGWGPDQWPALKALWIGESGWRTTAGNPTSGAYGIPQSLPASKMASAGRDYRTNPATQIRWGLKYIRSRYGSPAAALRAWRGRSPHWYKRGGFVGGLRRFGYGGFTNRQLGLPKKATNKQARQRFLDMRALGMIGRTTLPGARHPGPLQILTGKGGPVGNQIHAQLIAGQDALIIADADLNPNDANSIHAAQRIATADRRRVNYWRGRVAHFQKMLRGKHLTPYARQGAQRELRHALDMLGSSTSDATSAIEDVQSRKDAGVGTTQADVVAALNEVRDAVKAQNQTLASVDGVTVKTATKLLADVLVGQAGYRTTQRMRTPNAGAQLARY